MEDLIKAFQIFAKYTQAKYPTSCEHDRMYVHVDPDEVSEEDIKSLEELGFNVDDEGVFGFSSYKFGSA